MRSQVATRMSSLQRLLNGAQGQRGLAVAPRREQEHVLAAAQVAEQRLQLLLAIDEGVVVGEVSERERVFLIHDCIIQRRTNMDIQISIIHLRMLIPG